MHFSRTLILVVASSLLASAAPLPSPAPDALSEAESLAAVLNLIPSVASTDTYNLARDEDQEALPAAFEDEAHGAFASPILYRKNAKKYENLHLGEF